MNFNMLFAWLVFVTLQIYTSSSTSSSNFQSILDSFESYIARANQIIPSQHYSGCLKHVVDNSFEVKCQFLNVTKSCPPGPPEPRVAWFLQCLSKTMVRHGFQVPVYIVHFGNEVRRERLTTQLKAANIKHVHYIRMKEDIVNISNPQSRIGRIRNHREGGQRLDVEHELCIQIVNASTRTAPGALHWGKSVSDLCRQHGTGGMLEKEVELAFANNVALEMMVNCTTSNCVSNATVDHLRYALLLEDDAFISVTALQQLAVMLLTGPEIGDLYWMCDSNCAQPPFQLPPAHLLEAYFTNVYPEYGTKTTAAVMVSLPTIHKMLYGSNWIPAYRAIDHWYNYFVQKEHLVVHHAFPPVFCHGSHGLEQAISSGRTLKRKSCCDEFYEVKTMTPNFNGLVLVKKAGYAHSVGVVGGNHTESGVAMSRD